MHSITEVVKIKNGIKSNKAVFCFVAFLLIFSAVLVAFINHINNDDFSPAASHTVLSRWENENGRRVYINNTDIEKEMLCTARLSSIPSSQTKLIIKTENLRFTLFTRGKILFKNSDKRLCGYGKSIHIIDISDLKDKSEINLFLIPVKGEKGRIEGDIFLTSKNDYLLDLICKNQKTALIFILLFVTAFALAVIGIFGLFRKKKTAPKAMYLALLLAVCGIIILLKSDLSQFVLGGEITRYIALYSSYSLLGIFACSFICSLLNFKSRAISLYCYSALFYSVLRAVLFAVFSVALSSCIIISHLFFFFGIILPIILKLFRIRKSFKNYLCCLSYFILQTTYQTNIK